MNIELFRVGEIWHYRFQIEGKRRQRTTREKHRGRAETVAERAYRHAQLWATNGEVVPTLSELVVQWLRIHEQSVSRAHFKVVSTFGRLHLHGLGDITIDQLTTGRVEMGRARHLETHAPISANQWLKVMKLLCNWAVRRGHIPTVPFRLRMLKVQKKPRALLPTALAQQWLDALDAHARHQGGVCMAVRLMLGLGLRESETISARWEWLDVARALYTPGRTKGREAEPLPVPAWLLDYLRPLRQPSGLMATKPNGSGYASGFTRNAMLVANQAVGAPHITAHRLRGTFATLLSEEGVPVQSIQRVMRHKNVTTTVGYLESSMDHVISGQQRIARRLNIK